MSTRILILNAASQIIEQAGLQNFTLDAVAQQAGVSKGGLLYHFPSKDALVAGMIEHALDQFEAAVEARMQENQTWIKAYLIETLETQHLKNSLLSAGIATLVSKPDLLNTIRQRYDQWINRAAQSHNGLLLLLAADGLWYGDFLGTLPLSDEQRDQLKQQLLEMCR
jgi:AcrR family transcriptional regulator